MPSKSTVILDSLNIAKRHAKPTRATMQGGIIDKYMPIDASAVALWCHKHGAHPARAGSRGAAKVRICRKCGGEI